MSPSLKKMVMPNASVGLVKADKVGDGKRGTDKALPESSVALSGVRSFQIVAIGCIQPLKPANSTKTAAHYRRCQPPNQRQSQTNIP